MVAAGAMSMRMMIPVLVTLESLKKDKVSVLPEDVYGKSAAAPENTESTGESVLGPSNMYKKSK